MPTLTNQDYSVHKQQQRTLYAKINVLNFNYVPINEIQGVVLSGSITIDANSDMRRTASISLVSIDDTLKVSSESKIWLNKYIQIWTGIKDINDGSIVWTNHGIFMPNNPSIQYSPTDKTLSFEAVDLMSKLTGMRNGQIDGLSTVIPSGSNIRNVMRDIILQFTTFTQYSISKPDYNTTPADISIDAGGTVYDILTQLRDINPSWQMYFDVDGVFRFEQIPTGLNDATLVTDDLLSGLILDYSVNTDFENVKNYIEVYGKSHEPQYYTDDVVYSSGYKYTLTLPTLTESTLPDNATIGFVLPDTSGSVATIIIKNKDGVVVCNNYMVNENNMSTEFPSDTQGSYLVIKYTNPYFLYYGHQQAQATIFTSNLESPFYAGAYYECGKAKIDDTHYNQYNISNADGQITSFDSFNLNDALESDTIHFDSPDKVINAKIKIDGLDAKPFVNSDNSPALYKGDCIVVYNATTQKFVYKGSNQGIGVIHKICVGGDYDVIYTDALAYQRALYELYKSNNLNDSITMNCVPIYWLDVNNIMSFTLPNESKPTLWLIQNISLDISCEGTMSITAIKFYPEYPPWDYKPNNSGGI